MHSWKFNVTPLTVYKDRQGNVKLLEGRAAKIKSIMQDLES